MTEYICNNCEMKSKSLYSMNKHVNREKCSGSGFKTFEKVSQCPICKKKSLSGRFLSMHICPIFNEEYKPEYKDIGEIKKKLEIIKQKYKINEKKYNEIKRRYKNIKDSIEELQEKELILTNHINKLEEGKILPFKD